MPARRDLPNHEPNTPDTLCQIKPHTDLDPSHCLCLTLSLPLSLSHSPTQSLSHNLSLSHTHSFSLHTHTHTPPPARAHTHKHAQRRPEESMMITSYCCSLSLRNATPSQHNTCIACFTQLYSAFTTALLRFTTHLAFFVVVAGREVLEMGLGLLNDHVVDVAENRVPH